MKYDDASWHNLSNEVTWEQAAAHIAVFLRWCDQSGLTSAHLQEESGEELVKARSGEMTYTEFFLSFSDGKLIDEDLSEEGNRFAAAYYDAYLREYGDLCGFPNYTRTEQEHDLPPLFARLDQRLAEFRAGTLSLPRKKRRWWPFGKKN